MNFPKDFVRTAYSYFDPNDAWSGTENVSPLLYTLARMRRARIVVEYGAGLSTLFLAQALKDNHYDDDDSGLHLLYCFEKLPGNSTYVNKLKRALIDLGLNEFVDFFVGTPWRDAVLPKEIDLAWNDDAHYGEFLRDVWPKLNKRGLVAFHDTVANDVERQALQRRLDALDPNDYETMTIEEPHKTSQSSITLVCKIIYREGKLGEYVGA